MYLVKEINNDILVLIDNNKKVYTISMSSYDIQENELDRFLKKYIDISKNNGKLNITIIIDKFTRIIYHYYRSKN